MNKLMNSRINFLRTDMKIMCNSRGELKSWIDKYKRNNTSEYIKKDGAFQQTIKLYSRAKCSFCKENKWAFRIANVPTPKHHDLYTYVCLEDKCFATLLLVMVSK